MEQFKYKNVMQVPKLVGYLNMGLGEAKENAKMLEGAVNEIALYGQNLY